MTVEVSGTEGIVGQGVQWATSGMLLWRNIRDGGGCTYDLEVRGSDGNYYPATLSLETLYRVTLVIDHVGAGNTQTWVRQRIDTRPPPPVDGIWVRTESTNPGLDGMRVNVDAGRATVSLAPETGTFGRGDVLWRNLVPLGPSGYEFEVLGSDGQYYSASLTFEQRNRIRVDIEFGSAGSSQTWVRRRALTNAALDGPWTRIESTNPSNDGMVVAVGGEVATVANPAGSSYSVGNELWRGLERQNNGVGFDLEVLGSDGNYYPATLTLVDTDRIEVDIAFSSAGSDQVWTRGGEAAPAPPPAPALDGSWTRVESSNPQNDGMIVGVTGATASVENAAGSSYSAGATLWRGLSSEDTGYALEVLGSDGAYYPATLTFVGADRIEIDIESSGAGSDQVWTRGAEAPFNLDGRWTRTASSNPGNDGMQVAISGTEANVRYLPGSASSYRIGDTLWRSLAPSGDGFSLEVLGSDGNYYSATLTVVGPDELSLQIGFSSAGSAQTWTRRP